MTHNDAYRPHSHLTSSWKYWRIAESAKLSNGISVTVEGFLADPAGTSRKLQWGHSRLVHNSMAFDLGLGETPDLEHVDKLIAEMELTYVVVMITEYMDESLVLLKRLNCWDLDDVLYSSLKVKTKKPEPPPAGYEALVNAVNYADWKLYNHFNKTLWQKIRQEDGFAEEVAEFRRRNALLQQSCRPWATWGEDKHRRALLEDAGLADSDRRCHLAMLDSVGFSRVFKYRQGVPVKECRTQAARFDVAHIPGRGPLSEAIAAVFFATGFYNRVAVGVPKSGYTLNYPNVPTREDMVVFKPFGFAAAVKVVAGGRIRFNKEALDQIIVTGEKQRFKYCVSLWDPVLHFVWAWEALNVPAWLAKEGAGPAISMEQFLGAPALFLPLLPQLVASTLWNGQSYELGLVSTYDRVEGVRLAAAAAEAGGLDGGGGAGKAVFDVVNTDKFMQTLNHYTARGLNLLFYGDEDDLLAASLVLMRRTLCWDEEDVVVLLTEADQEEQARLAHRATALPDETRGLIQAFNRHDSELYVTYSPPIHFVFCEFKREGKCMENRRRCKPAAA